MRMASTKLIDLTRGTFGKCQQGESVYLLRNVPIQIFAISYIILEV